MFCSNCGKELAAESKFCIECGARTATESAEKTSTAPKSIDDETIRAELKRYKQLNKGICLECGYQGLMGVSSEHVMPKWKRSLSVIGLMAVLAFMFLMLHWIVAVVIGLVVGGLTFATIDTKYKICPNCGNKLKQ